MILDCVSTKDTMRFWNTDERMFTLQIKPSNILETNKSFIVSKHTLIKAFCRNKPILTFRNIDLIYSKF